MSLNALSPFCVSMCYNTYPANSHCSVVFWQKTHAKGTATNPCTTVVVVFVSQCYCDFSYYFPSCSHKCTYPHNHSSLMLTERTSRISKAWISITHCLLSLNINLLNTFFSHQGQKLSGFIFHLHGLWAPEILVQFVKDTHKLTKAGTQTISWSQAPAL